MCLFSSLNNLFLFSEIMFWGFSIFNEFKYAFNNTNGLIKPSSDYYYQYAIGIKTGTTNPAGQCLIFAAEVDGRVVIGAAMKSTNRHADALAILKAAFKN